MRITKAIVIFFLLSSQALAQDKKAPGANDVIKLPANAKSDSIWTEERRNSTPSRDVQLKKIPEIARGPAPQRLREAGSEAELSNQKASGNVQSQPFYWAGQVFFQAPDGSPGRCSGQFIDHNIVLTAAHCVRDDTTGEWYGNIKFFLQYAQDEASQSYTAKCAWTKNGWLSGSPENFRYDYALIVTDEPSITGHFGWQVNWGDRYAAAMAIGYPAAIRRGEIVQYVPGEVFFAEGLPGIIGLRHGTRSFTQGASGGAWIGQFKRGDAKVGGANYVISLNSFINDNNPGVMFGPYLDDEFASLISAARKECD